MATSRYAPRWTYLLLLAAVPVVGWAEAPPKQAEHGRLRTFEGLPVLELWGTRTEAAYAHGFLLAPQIVELMDDFALSDAILPDLSIYSAMILPSQRIRFDWSPFVAEVAAMLRGMQDRLGAANVRSKKLDRALSVDDLMAINTIPDWHGLMCSSFSVWGGMTADGDTLTARNLDYDFTPTMAAAQHVLVYHGDGQTQPYAAISWPGVLGVFTGVNAESVTMLSHDANSLQKSYMDGFTPRGLIFREALEAARAATSFEDVQRVFQSRRVICGNNQHVSAPRTDKLPRPAEIIEYDSNEQNRGVTLRGGALIAIFVPEPTDSAAPAKATAKRIDDIDAVCTTNHLCSRKNPQRCWRYEKLAEGLLATNKAGEKLTAETAFKLVRTAAVTETLHTVVVESNKGVMHVLIPAVKDEVVKVPYAEWLKAKPGE